jgi:hypothetical protein
MTDSIMIADIKTVTDVKCFQNLAQHTSDE